MKTVSEQQDPVGPPAPEERPPINGAELVDYWQREGLIGSRPDLPESLNHARALRAEAERRRVKS